MGRFSQHVINKDQHREDLKSIYEQTGVVKHPDGKDFTFFGKLSDPKIGKAHTPMLLKLYSN